MSMVPSVTTKGGILPKPTSRPFTAPQAAPVRIAARAMRKMELVVLKTIMVTPVHSTSWEPTDRSIWPVMMTKAMPRAMVPTMTVFWLERMAAMWLHLKVLPLEVMVKA